VLHLGFTGTRYGMTPAQSVAVERLTRRLAEAHYVVAHHGDCVGADAEFHEIARLYVDRIVIHPPVDEMRRAFCRPADEWRDARSHLARNQAIVTESMIMIAAPFECEHRRGGTWYTIAHVRKLERPLALVLRNGGDRCATVEFSGNAGWPR
jgi:hypothetical protein